MHNFFLSPLFAGFCSVVAALISGVFGVVGGSYHGRGVGRVEGETKFINAVQDAAQVAISGLMLSMAELKVMHRECLDKHQDCQTKVAALEEKIKEIMGANVPVYKIGHPGEV